MQPWKAEESPTQMASPESGTMSLYLAKGEIQVKTPDMVKLPQILGGAQLNHIGP